MTNRTSTLPPSRTPAGKNVPSIPAGAHRTPRPGTMRYDIVAMLAAKAGTTHEALYSRYGNWNKRHLAECFRILRDDYGYVIATDPKGVHRLDLTGTAALAKANGKPATGKSATAPRTRTPRPAPTTIDRDNARKARADRADKVRKAVQAPATPPPVVEVPPAP